MKHPPHFQDLAGKKFGRWTVIRQAGRRPSGDITWLCKCDCGNIREVIGGTLRGGYSGSCGCLRNDINRTHGQTNTLEFSRWRGMIGRCHNPNYPCFSEYGGRGITVCDRWRNSFENFFADMGPIPKGFTLDRIDNSKGYSPENCRWATPKQQARNMRKTLYATLNGETLPLIEWAEKVGFAYGTVLARIKNGWTDVDALTVPVGSRGRWSRT